MVPGCVVGSTARGKQDDVGGQARARVVRPGDARVDAAEVGAERVAADERLEVVVGVAGDERTDDGEPVGRAARWGKVPPKVTPGIVVATSPVALRTPSGRSIFGSNVSIWLGPPCRKRKITDFPVSTPGISGRARMQRRQVGKAQSARPECGGAPDPEE